MVTVYSCRLYAIFKGGTLARSYAYTLGGFVLLTVAFTIDFTLNLVELEPIGLYDISVGDLGVLLGAVFIGLGLHDREKFWEVPKEGLVAPDEERARANPPEFRSPENCEGWQRARSPAPRAGPRLALRRSRRQKAIRE